MLDRYCLQKKSFNNGLFNLAQNVCDNRKQPYVRRGAMGSQSVGTKFK